MYYNRKIAFYTLGCKLNFSETSAIAQILTDQGFQKVDFSDRADYYVINTCSVTENADRETKHVVRTAMRTNPDAKIIVIGCYAQLKPEEISSIPGVSMVLGANEKFRIYEHLEKLEDQSAPITKVSQALVLNGDIGDVNFFNDAYSLGERTRSFMKVQDGCDYFCSFCTIPMARGKSRSGSIEHTVAVARKVAATGVKEIVLTGVNIGDFGKTSPLNPPKGDFENSRRGDFNNSQGGESFFGLIQELEKIEGVERFRISSIEPNLLTDEIIEFVAASSRFMPHFHIPLQSGSDKILKLMRRKYLRQLYRDRVEKIKSLMPHACIGADVIVGFPGETHEQFLETYEFINELDISYLHVFTYSERANTRAVNMEAAVPLKERKERNKMLRILSEKKKRKFYEGNIHTSRKVLFEAGNENGMRFGFTDNYIKVGIPYEEEMWNTIQTLSLHHVSESGYVTGMRHLEYSLA